MTDILAQQGLRHLPLAIGAPMGTPLGLSADGRFQTVWFLGRINVGETPQRTTAKQGRAA